MQQTAVKKLEEGSPESGIVVMNVTDTAIAQFKADYMGLTIAGIEDKAGFKKVYEARQEVKSTRVSLVKHSKGLKEKALEWQRKVNAEEKRLVTELEAIEAYLQKEEDRIEADKQAVKQAAIDAENKRIQDRMDKLAVFGLSVEYATLKLIDDESFQRVLVNAENEFKKDQAAKAEEKRLAEVAAAQLKADQEELEKLRNERAEAQRIIDENNARIKAEQDAKEAEILAAKKKLEDDKLALEAEKKRESDLAKAREEAAEAARVRAIAEAKKAEDFRLAAEKAAKEEADRQLALRPDKEKLEAFAKKMGHAIDFQVSDPKAQLILNDISSMIGKMQIHIFKKVKEL